MIYWYIHWAASHKYTDKWIISISSSNSSSNIHLASNPYTFAGLWIQFFWTKILLDPNFFKPDYFLTQKFVEPNFVYPKYCGPIFFVWTFFLCPDFFGPKFFWAKIFSPKIFLPWNYFGLCLSTKKNFYHKINIFDQVGTGMEWSDKCQLGQLEYWKWNHRDGHIGGIHWK